MKIAAFILSLAIIIFSVSAVPLPAGENIDAGGSDPLFTSYIAPYERSNYFVDEGWRLVYYKENISKTLTAPGKNSWTTDTPRGIRIKAGCWIMGIGIRRNRL